ncbi:hypothetical protein BDK62_102418 [Halomonas alkaliantarctica]|jgi:hypothetical protein|nr:hypothetical protein BDK62_102418 [Halomonas alkaliantarctica]
MLDDALGRRSFLAAQCSYYGDMPDANGSAMVDHYFQRSTDK